MQYRTAIIFVLFVSVCAGTLRAQSAPTKVDVCDLAGHPKSFDAKIIEVRGSLNVFFEDFSLAHPGCAEEQQIWLAFGGDVPGVVPSTANDNWRTRGEDFRVNGVRYAIKKDDSFRRLYALIAARRGDKPEYRATATLTGKFLAGKESKSGRTGNPYFSGYGHLGCCSLLIITEVSEVESTPPPKLTLSGVVLGPDGKFAQGVTVYDDVDGGEPQERQAAVTDQRGEFRFSNSGQRLRIEDSEYRPIEREVEPGGARAEIKLKNAKESDWIPRECAVGDLQSRIGFSVRFALPSAMTSSSFNEDGQSFFVFKQGNDMTEAEFFISHSSQKVSDSPRSPDTRWVKDEAGKVIGVDSRWVLHGYFGRNFAFPDFDDVGYSTKSAALRETYDRIIDSACIAKR